MRNKEIFEMTLASTFIVIILLMSLIPQLGFVTILPGVSITLVHIPTLIAVFILRPRSGLVVSIMFGVGSLIASYIYAATPFDFAFRNPLISVVPRALFGLTAWGIFHGFLKISKLSFGRYIMFGLVTLVTTFAIYFGTVQIAKNVVWNEYNKYVTETPVEEQEQTVLDQIFLESQNTENQVLVVVIPVALVIIVGFIGLYFYFITKDDYNNLAVSSSFVLGTLAHTVLVLSFVMLFASDFHMAFGDAVTLIYGIAASNGLIEALAAVAIGTPIYTALRKLPALENYIHQNQE